MRKIDLKNAMSRHTTMPANRNSSFLRAFMIVSPMLIYYTLCQWLTIVVAAFFTNSVTEENVNVASFAQNNSMKVAMIIRSIAIIGAVLPLIPSINLENIKIWSRKETFNRRAVVYTVMLAMGSAGFANAVLFDLGIVNSSEAYSTVAQSTYSAPLLGGIVFYGLLTPLAEEIVNRALIYNRARRFFNLPLALMISPLLFAVSHGNLPQFIYAFLMGVVICIIYEKYGAFLYPVCFHMVANIYVFTSMKNEWLKQLLTSIPGIVIGGVITVVFLYLIMSDNVREQ